MRFGISVLFSLGLSGIAPAIYAEQAPTATPAATTAPAAVLQSEGETDAEKRVKTYSFRNSTFAWYQSMSAITLDKNAELTYNPTYSWLFRFQPRYYPTDKLSLRLKFDINLELTNSDDTTKYHQAQLGETWFDVVYGPLFKEKYTGLEFTPSFRFVIPTSPASQARTLMVGLAPGFALTRTFKFGNGMELELGYAFRYIKDINRYTTVQYDSPTILTCAGGAADCGAFLSNGARNPSHEFWNFLTADLSFTKKLKFTLMVAFYNSLLYDVPPQLPTTLAGNVPLAVGTTNGNDVNSRASIWYYGELSYQIHPTVAVGVGFSTFTPQLTEDSHYRAPFFNRFTEVILTTTISLDHLVALFDRRPLK
jgi:hypothetical protein